jgi:hypothetical protein
MLGWTDLKACKAACWNTSWKVDPLPFSVPEIVLDVPPVEDEEGEPDEEQAARTRAKPTTAAAAAPCCLRRRCITVLLLDSSVLSALLTPGFTA